MLSPELLDATGSRWLVLAGRDDDLVTFSLPTTFARVGPHPFGAPTSCSWATAYLTPEELLDLVSVLAAAVRQLGGDPREVLGAPAPLAD